MQRRLRQRGFTLIELVLVIVLLGVLSGILVPIILQAVQAHRDTEDRSDLLSKGRVALERLARVVRQAVPNSLEVVSDGTGNPGIQFVASRAGGRYIDTSDDFGTAFAVPARRFTTNRNRTRLYILGTTLALQADDRLVIGNTSPAELKAGNTVVTLTGITATALAPDGTDQGQVLEFAGHSFPHDSPGRHYGIADSTHEVGFLNGALRWHRADGLGGYNNAGDWSAADPALMDGVVFGAGDPPIFTYSAGTPESSGVLRVRLKLQQAQEIVELYHEVHIRNTP